MSQALFKIWLVDSKGLIVKVSSLRGDLWSGCVERE